MEKIMSLYTIYNTNSGFSIKKNCTKFFKEHTYKTNLEIVIETIVIPHLLKLYYLKGEI